MLVKQKMTIMVENENNISDPERLLDFTRDLSLAGDRVVWRRIGDLKSESNPSLPSRWAAGWSVKDCRSNHLRSNPPPARLKAYIRFKRWGQTALSTVVKTGTSRKSDFFPCSLESEAGAPKEASSWHPKSFALWPLRIKRVKKRKFMSVVESDDRVHLRFINYLVMLKCLQCSFTKSLTSY